MKHILIDIEDHTALLTINRPESLNALNKELIEELSLSISDLDNNPNIKVILLTGSGTKAFVAGADIKELQFLNSNQAKILAKEGQDILFNKIENLTKPAIALINGFALGGGLELALACNFRIASKNAKMGLPEVTLGLIPGYGGTQRLPSLIGKGRAMQMIVTAEMITAEKAEKIGLINEMVELDELLNRGKELAQTISKNSALAISKAIQSINTHNQPIGYDTEINLFSSLFESKDFKEGTLAFIEKRKPVF